jgi:hypothetical protein
MFEDSIRDMMYSYDSNSYTEVKSVLAAHPSHVKSDY